MHLFGLSTPTVVGAENALPGREQPVLAGGVHHVLGTPLLGPYPDGAQIATFAMGCFWGAERIFWELQGAYTTAVGYTAGFTPNPTYEEVCSSRTGHAEAVQVVFLPDVISYPQLLQAFWEGHDPTQGMRQGNDTGTQYRSGIYFSTPAQRDQALASRDAFQQALTASGYGQITTEIAQAGPFYHAEEYHQQYLSKNPAGYCGLGETGVSCPAGIAAPSAVAGSLSSGHPEG